MRNDVVFPVTVVHVDEPDVEDDDFWDVDSLGQEVEFYDEFSPERLEFVDAVGSPLRVVAYALEVVLVRALRFPISIQGLRLSRCVRADGCSGEAEICDESIHRVLWDDGTVEPLYALDEIGKVHLKSGSTSSLEGFARTWLEARIRQLRRTNRGR